MSIKNKTPFITFLDCKLANDAIKRYLSIAEPTAQDAFALGAQLMYFGQKLTTESGFPLEPATIEAKVLLAKIVDLVSMPTINPEG